MFARPSLDLPEPLRASEIPSFTNFSVVVRLPEIARRTLAENSFPVETVARIQALIDEIPTCKIRPIELPLSPCAQAWAGWIKPYMGMNWLDIPWFFAEEYFYLRILEATNYFAEGSWYKRDPYHHQKQLGLESSRAAARSLAVHVEDALKNLPGDFRSSLARLLLIDLWGNQNDLSMWPVSQKENGKELTGGTAGESAGAGPAESQILSNDLPAFLAYFDRLDPASTRLDIVLDNAGYELITDLALTDFLITSGRSTHVSLHAKAYPVFVSDALDVDIHETLDFLTFDEQPEVRAMAIRLRSYLVDRRLSIHHHPFWTSPLPAWEMPADVAAENAAATITIFKGDANYRRLLGDRHWPVEMPFAQVIDYFPCSVLALRTLKSEIAVGIPTEKIPSDDPKWMYDGRWGVIQFAKSAI